jgi:fatty acid desaturase
MKLFSIIAAILFAYSAVLQFNDPDPIRWILLYASVAMLSAASIFVSVPPSIFIGFACLAGLWAATLLPDVVSARSFTGTEVERELAGLFLVSVTSLLLWRFGDRGVIGNGGDS